LTFGRKRKASGVLPEPGKERETIAISVWKMISGVLSGMTQSERELTVSER